MTAIAGIIDKSNDVTYLASDSAGSNGHTTYVYNTSKVIKIDGLMSIAYCGRYRAGNLLQYNLDLRRFMDGETVDDYVYKYLVDRVRSVFENGGIMGQDSNVEVVDKFVMIMAIRDKIYTYQEDNSVLEPSQSFVAAGSGKHHVEASMDALFSNTEIEPVGILRKSIDLAAKYVMSVGGKVNIIEHKHK